MTVVTIQCTCWGSSVPFLPAPGGRGLQIKFPASQCYKVRPCLKGKNCLNFMMSASTVFNFVICHLNSVNVIRLNKSDYVRHLLYLQKMSKSQEFNDLLL